MSQFNLLNHYLRFVLLKAFAFIWIERKGFFYYLLNFKVIQKSTENDLKIVFSLYLLLFILVMEFHRKNF